MPNPTIWPLEDILKYLDDHSMRVIIKNGQTRLDCPKQTTAEQKAEIIPQLKAQKTALVEHFTGKNPYRSFYERVRLARQARISEVRRLVAEAAATGRIVYMLHTAGKLNGLAEQFRGKLPDEIGYISISGATYWNKLTSLLVRPDYIPQAHNPRQSHERAPETNLPNPE